MVESEIIVRIKNLCEVRSWTYYRLAKESGITYSTLSTLLNKSNTPSFSTLSKICDGFGISLSQFFSDDEMVATLAEEHKALLGQWDALSEDNRAKANSYICFLLDQQKQAK